MLVSENDSYRFNVVADVTVAVVFVQSSIWQISEFTVTHVINKIAVRSNSFECSGDDTGHNEHHLHVNCCTNRFQINHSKNTVAVCRTQPINHTSYTYISDGRIFFSAGQVQQKLSQCRWQLQNHDQRRPVANSIIWFVRKRLSI